MIILPMSSESGFKFVWAWSMNEAPWNVKSKRKRQDRTITERLLGERGGLFPSYPRDFLEASMGAQWWSPRCLLNSSASKLVHGVWTRPHGMWNDVIDKKGQMHAIPTTLAPAVLEECLLGGRSGQKVISSHTIKVKPLSPNDARLEQETNG